MRGDTLITLHQAVKLTPAEFQKRPRIDPFLGGLGQFDGNTPGVLIPGQRGQPVGFLQLRHLQILLYGGENPDQDIDTTDGHRGVRLVLEGDTRSGKRRCTTDGGKGDGGDGEPGVQKRIIIMSMVVEPPVTLGNIPPFGQDFFILVGPFHHRLGMGLIDRDLVTIVHHGDIRVLKVRWYPTDTRDDGTRRTSGHGGIGFT